MLTTEDCGTVEQAKSGKEEEQFQCHKVLLRFRCEEENENDENDMRTRRQCQWRGKSLLKVCDRQHLSTHINLTRLEVQRY